MCNNVFINKSIHFKVLQYFLLFLTERKSEAFTVTALTEVLIQRDLHFNLNWTFSWLRALFRGPKGDLRIKLTPFWSIVQHLVHYHVPMNEWIEWLQNHHLPYASSTPNSRYKLHPLKHVMRLKHILTPSWRTNTETDSKWHIVLFIYFIYFGWDFSRTRAVEKL